MLHVLSRSPIMYNVTSAFLIDTQLILDSVLQSYFWSTILPSQRWVLGLDSLLERVIKRPSLMHTMNTEGKL